MGILRGFRVAQPPSSRVTLLLGQALLVSAVVLAASAARAAGAAGTAETESHFERQARRTVIQYGVGFSTEVPLARGGLCPANQPCILGAGGGIAARLGFRVGSTYYLGGAYSVTKQDSDKLYRLSTLQQARAEGRYFLDGGRAVSPYAFAALGAAAYGNEWGVDTFGPLGSLGLGLTAEVTPRTLLGFSAGYRAIRFQAFDDPTGLRREASYTHMFSMDLTMEVSDVW